MGLQDLKALVPEDILIRLKAEIRVSTTAKLGRSGFARSSMLRLFKWFTECTVAATIQGRPKNEKQSVKIPINSRSR